jgi:hypothetical protein
MSKTIKQLADELRVSKPTIAKVIADLHLEPVKVRNRFELSDEDCSLVKTQISQGKLQISQSDESQKTQISPKLQGGESQISQSELQKSQISMLETQISLLQEQLAVKDEQLATKDEQIKLMQAQFSVKDEQISQLTAALQQQTSALESTTAALTAAQALHAADKRSLMLLEDKENERKLSFWERRAAKKAAKKARKEQAAE